MKRENFRNMTTRAFNHLGPAAVTLLAMAALFASWSCTVLEDRDVCPAYLTVRSDGHVGEAGFNKEITYNLSTQSERVLERANSPFETFRSEGKIFKVPRKETVDVMAFGGLRDMAFIGDVLRITPGKQCDSLLCGSGNIWIPADLGEIKVPLYRNYCRVQMGLVGEVYYPYPYYFVVKGNVDGYTLPDLKPHPGEFWYRCDVLAGDIFEARVPRQLDNSLIIEARLVEDGSLVTEIPLGQIADQMGYDWHKTDLDDMLINIDFARTMITISVNDWTQEVLIKIII